jgi:hypothetical protein
MNKYLRKLCAAGLITTLAIGSVGCSAQGQVEALSKEEAATEKAVTEEVSTEEVASGHDHNEARKNRPLGFGISNPDNLLKMEKGTIIVRYPEGYEELAEENLDRLNKMVEYYKEELDIDFDFQLWMCDEANWPEGGAPYGMPSCDQQNNAVLVSVKGGCIVEATLPQLENAPQQALDLFEQAGVTPQEGLEVFPLLLGYHEIGHLLMNENGFHNATRWFNEFLASYHGLAYMAEFEPELAAIWEANAYISPYSEGEMPKITDLNALNEGKIEPVTPEGVKNYDWMQKEFMKLCVLINDELGFSFIHSLEESIGDKGLGTQGELDAMAKVTNQWNIWLENL